MIINGQIIQNEEELKNRLRQRVNDMRHAIQICVKSFLLRAALIEAIYEMWEVSISFEEANNADNLIEVLWRKGVRP